MTLKLNPLRHCQEQAVRLLKYQTHVKKSARGVQTTTDLTLRVLEGSLISATRLHFQPAQLDTNNAKISQLSWAGKLFHHCVERWLGLTGQYRISYITCSAQRVDTINKYGIILLWYFFLQLAVQPRKQGTTPEYYNSGISLDIPPLITLRLVLGQKSPQPTVMMVTTANHLASGMLVKVSSNASQKKMMVPKWWCCTESVKKGSGCHMHCFSRLLFVSERTKISAADLQESRDFHQCQNNVGCKYQGRDEYSSTQVLMSSN